MRTEVPDIGVWTGASGKAYAYAIYQLPTHLESVEGNFIYTRLQAMHYPIFVGEGDISVGITDHAQLENLASKGPTHIHVHANADPEKRKAERDDLEKMYPNKYASFDGPEMTDGHETPDG